MISSYLEIWKRSVTGKKVEKAVWDLEHIVLAVKRLVSEYGLTWDKKSALPQDSALIDRLFLAGLELAVSEGIYCITTGRVIKFSYDEITEAMHRMPQRLPMGEGDDARLLFSRMVEDKRPPLIWAGSPFSSRKFAVVNLSIAMSLVFFGDKSRRIPLSSKRSRISEKTAISRSLGAVLSTLSGNLIGLIYRNYL